MTEHEKLVERLRKVELWFTLQSDMRFVHLAARDAAAALTLANARIARLEDALRPFADTADDYPVAEDWEVTDFITIWSLRRARAALKGDA